jgi:hypothetical protein
VPRAAVNSLLITVVEQRVHVDGVEIFPLLDSEIRSDISEVIVYSIVLRCRVYMRRRDGHAEKSCISDRRGTTRTNRDPRGRAIRRRPARRKRQYWVASMPRPDGIASIRLSDDRTPMGPDAACSVNPVRASNGVVISGMDRPSDNCSPMGPDASRPVHPGGARRSVGLRGEDQHGNGNHASERKVSHSLTTSGGSRFGRSKEA